MDSKHKKELKDMAETNTAQNNQLNSTIRRLEKENKTLNERLELSSKSMMSEQGGLEKKIERVQEERDRLKEDIETIKVDRDRKLDEMRRQYEREKDIIKQKNNEHIATIHSYSTKPFGNRRHRGSNLAVRRWCMWRWLWM